MRGVSGWAGWAARDRGSAAIEAAILIPALIMLISLVVAAGRIRTADGAVAEAARDAARAASLTVSGNDNAASFGEQTGDDTLRQLGVTCDQAKPVTVTVDFAAAGQVGTATAHVACTVPLSDLLWSGLPGSVPLTYNFTAAIDAYRSQ